MLRLMTKTPSNRPACEPDWPELRRRLVRFASALTGSVEEAEDLTQQTFAALLAKAPGAADHAGYARTTLTRLWIDRQRSLRRRARTLRAYAATLLDHAAPKDPAGHVEQTARARRAIDLLPPRQRAAIVMRLVEGLDYATIARELGCEVGAVRASLHLARASLRESLGDRS